MKKMLLILSLFVMSCVTYSTQNVKDFKILDAWSSCVKTRPSMSNNSSWCEGPLRKVTVIVYNPYSKSHTVTLKCFTESNNLFGKTTFSIKPGKKVLKLVYGLNETSNFANKVSCMVE